MCKFNGYIQQILIEMINEPKFDSLTVCLTNCPTDWLPDEVSEWLTEWLTAYSSWLTAWLMDLHVLID